MTSSRIPPVTKCTIVAANCAVLGGAIYITAQPAASEYARCAAAGVKTALSVRTPGETNAPSYDFNEPATWQSLGIPFANFPLAHGMPQGEFDVEATMAAHILALTSTSSLIHCSTGDRASSVVAVALVLAHFCSAEEAANWARTNLFLEAFYDYVVNYTPVRLALPAPQLF